MTVEGPQPAASLYDLPWLYDALCPALRDGDPELAWWLGACGAGAPNEPAEPGRRAPTVLEIGAGTGRLTLPLARAGLAMTGLDLSPAMLATARARAREAGLDVRWVEGDMRDFDIAQPGGFDRVIVPFNTFLHLHTRDDHRRFFERVRAHLAPGGRLALSIVSPDPETLGRRPGHRLRLHAHELVHPETGERLVLEETVRWDHATQTTRGRFHVSSATEVDLLVVPMDLRMVFPQELLLLLELEGFVVRVHQGGYDGRPFDASSLSQNVVAEVGRASG
ncbi:MAG: class I SAM-dependent methyltransferase [Deltaproteobacteria bacterium]|nr:class I SAM-dependent methyltransferase [Deltaproteobacteria bacterium]